MKKVYFKSMLIKGRIKTATKYKSMFHFNKEQRIIANGIIRNEVFIIEFLNWFNKYFSESKGVRCISSNRSLSNEGIQEINPKIINVK